MTGYADVDQPIIQCHGVTKHFGVTYAVSELDLTIEPGEIVAFVGPSGSGKTTLLRLVAGFEAPDMGTITLDGHMVAGAGTWEPPEARRLGMVFQDYALFPHKNVAQNIAFGLKGWSGDSKGRRVREILETVRMPHLAERFPHELSGGEQQRVALARSLAPSPIALLLDEPFSNLDPHLRWQMRNEVKQILRATRTTAMYVTHDQEEALFMGDRVAVMNRGRLEGIDAPEDIYHKPANRFVANFLGIAHFIRGKATENGLVTEIGVLHARVQLEPGTEVEAIVRPDDVGIRPSTDGLGRVVRRMFRGTHYLYEVELSSGTEVYILQHHTAFYEEGDRLDVYLEPNQTLTCFVVANQADGQDGSGSFLAVTG